MASLTRCRHARFAPPQLDLEMNGLMKSLISDMITYEVERERVAQIMGSPEWSQLTVDMAIAEGKSKNDSSEIGAAAFISFGTFLVCLFNAVRFGLLFYKSRNNEKLVATDMTFTSTD